MSDRLSHPAAQVEDRPTDGQERHEPIEPGPFLERAAPVAVIDPSMALVEVTNGVCAHVEPSSCSLVTLVSAWLQSLLTPSQR